MHEVLRVHVLGVPTPQGSKVAFINRRTQRAGMKDANEVELREWRGIVSRTVYEAREAQNHATMDGPVAVRLVFVFPRIKTARRRDHWKPTKPDGDKLERAVWDALTDAGVFRDDGQVCDWGGRKRMSMPDHPSDPPGVYIVVGIPDNPLDPPEPEQVPLPHLTALS